MSYVALYRKYRPATFDEVIGQDHIINTLRNQILQDKVSHAYLFTGTRGTGKTSTAKIFARAVNCPHVKEHNGNPCGKCSVCNTVGNANLDIIEMDAASNNGVDYARDIREKVQYPPVNGRYKVYIIDEVHMLSVGAFNALLKTLEEPPKHAIFILCTTEVHKIPATILSRCMRFDFRLVPTPELAKLVAHIYDAEGKEYAPEAVTAIAQAGEGSVRDCVSIADRCLSVSDDKLEYADVLSVLGVSSKNSIVALARAIFANSPSDILTEINKLVTEGKDIARLNKDLSLYIRDVLTAKVCKDANSILMLPQDAFATLREIAETVSVKKLLYAIDRFVSAEASLKYALSPLMLFEATALSVASSSGDVDAEGLDRRLTRLEQQYSQTKETRSLYVVDKTDPKSVWRGVKMQIDEQNEPLLNGVWSDVKVSFDAQGNFVVRCSDGAYWLIENKFKKRLTACVAMFCDGKLIVEQDDGSSQTEIDKQLSALGKDVKFD